MAVTDKSPERLEFTDSDGDTLVVTRGQGVTIVMTSDADSLERVVVYLDDEDRKALIVRLGGILPGPALDLLDSVSDPCNRPWPWGGRG